jgi:aspartokinase
METIAIYWEKQVKIYGILLKKSMNLLSLQLDDTSFHTWQALLTNLEKMPVQFEHSSFFATEKQAGHLYVILESEQLAVFQDHNNLNHGMQDLKFSFTTTKIDLIYLHGPHFQERFGILARAVEPLLANKIELLLTGCAGNSMYLAVPEDQGEKSTALLHETFHTPRIA